jgi:hypothetical protein
MAAAMAAPVMPAPIRVITVRRDIEFRLEFMSLLLCS